MSDELTTAIGNSLSSEDITNAINTSAPKFMDGIKENIQSSQESLKKIQSDLQDTGWFGEVFDELLNIKRKESDNDDANNKEVKAFLESMKTMQEDMLGYTVMQEKDEKTTKSKKTKTSSLKIDDLKELPNSLGIGFALLSSQLTARDEKDAKNKKGGLSGFFKGLMEGVGGIAALGVALLAFAAATVLFNFVDWPKALLGLVAFAGFTLGMVGLTKLLGKSAQKDLKDFAISAVIMAAALGVFAISLAISSMIFSGENVFGLKVNMPGAILAVGSFLLFSAGIILVSKLLGKEEKSFVSFAKATVIMSLGLVVFALALSIASHIFSGEGFKVPGTSFTIKVDLIGAMKAVGLFSGFIIAMAAASFIASANEGNFKDFARATLILSASILLFGFTLFLTSGIVEGRLGDKQIGLELKFDFNQAMMGVGLFAIFIGAFVGMAILLSKQKASLMEFAVASAIMSGSLIVFALGIFLVSKVVSGGRIEHDGTSLNIDGLVPAIAGLGLFLVFIGTFAAIGYFAASQMPAIMSLSIAAIAMAGSLLLFGAALGVTIAAVMGGEAKVAGIAFDFGKERNDAWRAAAALGGLVMMGLFVAGFAVLGAKAIALSPLLAAAAAAGIGVGMAITMIAKAMGLAALIGNGSGGKMIFANNVYDIPAIGNDDVSKGMDKVSSTLKAFADIGFLAALKAASIALTLGPVIQAIALMVDVTAKAVTLDAEVKAKTGKSINDMDLSRIFDPVVKVIKALESTASTLGITGAAALAIISQAMLPIVQSMGMLVDIVEKAAYLKGHNNETVEAMLLKANRNLTMIMTGVPEAPNSGFVHLFNNIAAQTRGISADAAIAMQSFPPVVEALSGLTNLVEKAGQISPEIITKGLSGLERIAGFLDSLLTTLKSMLPGGVGGWFAKKFNGDPVKTLQDAHKVLGEGGEFQTVLQDLIFVGGLLTQEQFAKIANIQLLGTFSGEFISGTKNFADGLKHISDGVKRYQTSNIDGLERIADSMERMSGLDLSRAINPIVDLASEKNNLRDTATYMKQIADAFEKMTKKKSMSERMGDAVGNLKDTAKAIFGWNKEKSMAEQTGANSAASPITIQPGNELAGIAQIMEKWDAEGVKILGGTEKSKGQKPVPVKMLSV